MTYKSFTTLDDFFDHLVRRFRIQTPEGLSPAESEEWRKLKQHVIQIRYVIDNSSVLVPDAVFSVLNTLKAMVFDEDFLEKEDMYILNRMKEFLQNEDVSKFSGAKQLLTLVERAVSSAPLILFRLSDLGAIAWRRRQEGLDSYFGQPTYLDLTQAQ